MLKLITINVASKLIGIGQDTLRNYINNKYFIEPTACVDGDRMLVYDEGEVKKWIANDYPLLKELIKIETSKKKSISMLSKNKNVIDNIINNFE